MSNEENSIFSSVTVTDAKDLFIPGSRGFYIPSYQRPFVWDSDHIEALFEVFADGMQQLIKKPTNNGFSFIGTVITVTDTKAKKVDPRLINDVPEPVWHVVDGQQRLTVLMITFVILLEHLRLDAIQIDGKRKSLHAAVQKIMNRLTNVIEIPSSEEDGHHYPRIIRAQDDQWSATDKRKYESSIGRYLSKYGEFYRKNKKNGEKEFPYEEVLSGDSRRKFSDAAKCVQRIVQEIRVGEKNPLTEQFVQILDSSEALDNLITYELGKGDFSLKNEQDRKIVCTLALACYILDKVKFVHLGTHEEGYAFDIFESLNSTGEQLTPYETFKPQIVQFEGMTAFPKSKSREHTDVIERYLDPSKIDNVLEATLEVLISFALAETGLGLPKGLGENMRPQRRYLTEQYAAAVSGADKRLFTEHLMYVSETCEMWNDSGNGTEFFDKFELLKLPKDKSKLLAVEFSQTKFCLDFLRGAKHTIPRALIARFYAAVNLSSSVEERHKKAQDFCSVVKAVAALFAVWRSTRLDTDGIDAEYRKMMKEVFCRKHCVQANADISVEKVKEIFRRLLKDGGGNRGRKITSREDWIYHAHTHSMYSVKGVAKFIQLIASNDAVPDPKKLGYLIDARPGVYPPLIAGEIWGEEAYNSAEHLIPQSDPSLTDDQKHRLGNLTLLPKNVNSILKNRPWDEKRLMLLLPSAQTPDKVESVKTQLRAIDIKERSITKLSSAPYLPITSSIAQWDNFGTIKDIDARGKHLLTRAWGVLSKWLDFDRPL